MKSTIPSTKTPRKAEFSSSEVQSHSQTRGRENKHRKPEIVDRIYLRAESPLKKDALAQSLPIKANSNQEKLAEGDVIPVVEFKGDLTGIRVVVSPAPALAFPKSAIVESTIVEPSPAKAKTKAPAPQSDKKNPAPKLEADPIGIKVFEQTKPGSQKQEKVLFHFPKQEQTKHGVAATTEASPKPNKGELKGILKSTSKSNLHNASNTTDIPVIEETARKIPPPNAATGVHRIVNISPRELHTQLSVKKSTSITIPGKSASQQIPTAASNTSPEMKPTPSKSKRVARPASIRATPSPIQAPQPVSKSPNKDSPSASVLAVKKTGSPAKTQPGLAATLPQPTKQTRPTKGQPKSMTQSMKHQTKPTESLPSQGRHPENTAQDKVLIREKQKRERILREIDREELLHSKLLEKLEAQINKTGTEMERLTSLKSQTKQFLEEIAKIKVANPPTDDLIDNLEKKSQKSIARSASAKGLRSPVLPKNGELNRSFYKSVDLQSVTSRSKLTASLKNDKPKPTSSIKVKKGLQGRNPSKVLSQQKPVLNKQEAADSFIRSMHSSKSRDSHQSNKSANSKVARVDMKTKTGKDKLEKKKINKPEPAQYPDSPLTKLRRSRIEKQSNQKGSPVRTNIFERGSTVSKGSVSIGNSRSFFLPSELQKDSTVVVVEKDFQTLGRSSKSNRTSAQPVQNGNNKKPVPSNPKTSSQVDKKDFKHQVSERALSRTTPARTVESRPAGNRDLTDDEDYQLTRTSTSKKRLMGTKPPSQLMKEAQSAAVRNSRKQPPTLRESTVLLAELYAGKRNKTKQFV